MNSLSLYIDQIYIPPLHLWVDDRRDVAHVRQRRWPEIKKRRRFWTGQLFFNLVLQVSIMQCLLQDGPWILITCNFTLNSSEI